MIKQGLKLLVCSLVLALGLLSSMVVIAEDFRSFSLDFDSHWLPLPEDDWGDGIESVLFYNMKDRTALTINTQYTEKLSLNREEFKEQCQEVLKRYYIYSFKVISSHYDDAKNEALFVGYQSGLPEDLRVRHQNGVLVWITCNGPSEKEGLALADKMRIKYPEEKPDP